MWPTTRFTAFPLSRDVVSRRGWICTLYRLSTLLREVRVLYSFYLSACLSVCTGLKEALSSYPADLV